MFYLIYASQQTLLSPSYLTLYKTFTLSVLQSPQGVGKIEYDELGLKKHLSHFWRPLDN